jgi:hypothetical protein
MARQGESVSSDSPETWEALARESIRSHAAWRRAIMEESEETATRIWRRALTIQGKPVPPYPPSSPQDTGNIGEPPFSTRPLVDADRRRT